MTDSTLTYADYLKNLDDLYIDLMENGYKHHEIDQMDLSHFLRLLESMPKGKKRRGSNSKSGGLMSAEDFYNSI